MRVLALVALGAAVSACTAIAGLTDDYHLAGDAGGVGPGSEGGGGDGNVDKDGALPDGFVPGQDGGADAPIDQVVPEGGTFCDQYGSALNVKYCDDFELTTSGPKWGWDDFTTSSATIVRENGIGAGGSAALRATVTSAPAGGSSAYLRKQMAPDPFTSFLTQELSFSFSVSKKSTTYGATIGAIGYGASLKYIGVNVFMAVPDDGIDISDPPGFLSSPYQTAHLGDWHRAIITMTRTATNVYSSTVEVTKVGTTGATLMVDGPRAGFAGGTPPTEILVGAFFTSPSGGVEIIIDDVLLKQTK
jgi:hypothetical protein